MANNYIDSTATGANTGASKANAWISAASITGTAGDDFWISKNHNESAAGALTITMPGGVQTPCRLICADFLGGTPPAAADVTTGAQISSGNGALTVSGGGNGAFYAQGIKFTVGVGQSTNVALALNAHHGYYENCSFNVATTNTNARVQGTSASLQLRFRNCTASFAAAGQGFNLGSGHWYWLGGSVAATGTVPTTMIPSFPASFTQIVFDGVDLSAFGSGKNLVNAAAMLGVVKFINCKLGASVSVITGTINDIFHTDSGVDLIGCNSTGNVERNERYRAQGALTTETTIIRTAGGSDGTTPYSWKIAGTALASQTWPFETFEGVMWNTLVGSSRTLTFHCVTDNVALNSNDIWVEVEYLGDAGDSQGLLVSSGPANVLSSGSALASDSGEAWTTTGLTTPNKQKFSVSFTPQIAGPIRWKVRVAKPSTTIYLDPNPDLS